MILAIFVVCYIAVGFLICYFVLWLKDRLNTLEWSIDHPNPGVSTTTAIGSDDGEANECDIEDRIGFITKEKK